MFICEKCGRTFPGETGWAFHVKLCTAGAKPRVQTIVCASCFRHRDVREVEPETQFCAKCAIEEAGRLRSKQSHRTFDADMAEAARLDAWYKAWAEEVNA
jgi:hypothetical protein